MVQVRVGWRSQLQGLEANVVEGLVVEAEGHVAVLNQLVDGEDGVVRLDHDLGNLGESKLIELCIR